MTQLREMLNKKKSPAGNAVLVVFCAFLIILLLFDLYFTMHYLVVEVSGRSMQNTLQSGDFLYAERGRAPERGDIAIIDVSPYRERDRFSGDLIIKRIIGLGGDTVQIAGGKVYIRYAGEEDYRLLEEDYTFGETAVLSGNGTYEVKEGEIFFLGDHRTDSTDSRIVGCYLETDVVGVVPGWSVRMKSLISGWERIRSLLGGRTTTD